MLVAALAVRLLCSCPRCACLTLLSCCAELRERVERILGIPEELDDDRKNSWLKQTPYLRDYFMKPDSVHNLRRRHMDTVWRLCERDVDSVREAVRSLRLYLWTELLFVICNRLRGEPRAPLRSAAPLR